MGVNTFEYGDDVVGYCKLESTFGTGVSPAATDAFKALSILMQPVVDWRLAEDNKKTRSQMESAAGRSSATWSAECYFRPSGSLGVAPDIGELLKLVMGTEAVVASTSVTYTLLKDMTGLFATIFKDLTSMQEFVTSAIVQRFSISGNGEDYIRMTFSGVAKQYGKVGRVLADGSGGGATSLIVDDADDLAQWGLVQIDTDDNSGAGFLISALDHDTETATIPAASWDNNDPITAFLPTATLTGDPVMGVDGQISLDGDATQVKFLDWTINVDTGLDLLNREYGVTSPSDVTMPNSRQVTADLRMLIKQDETHLNSLFQRKQAQDLFVTVGDTATKRAKFDMPNFEMQPGQPTSPATGEVELSISGTAYGTGSGENELTILLD
jgi:hypothetical protein